jgi:hypothetical protein
MSAYVRLVDFSTSAAFDPRLRAVYERLSALSADGAPRPKVYATPSGEPPHIIQCHALEPEALWHTFSISTFIHWSERSLPWRLRELINTVTSGANDCFY